MAKLGGFVTFLYFLALAAGIISLMLPFWVTTEVDVETRTVTIIKRTQYGLWWSRDTYEIKSDSLTSDEKDDSWNKISGSPKGKCTTQKR